LTKLTITSRPYLRYLDIPSVASVAECEALLVGAFVFLDRSQIPLVEHWTPPIEPDRNTRPVESQAERCSRLEISWAASIELPPPVSRPCREECPCPVIWQRYLLPLHLGLAAAGDARNAVIARWRYSSLRVDSARATIAAVVTPSVIVRIVSARVTTT